MKRAFLIIVAVLTTAATGCAGRQCACGNGGCGPGPLRPRGYALSRDGGGILAGHHGRHGGMDEGPDDGGMGAAAVGYPYYTTRGPRDFFANNPPSIGR